MYRQMKTGITLAGVAAAILVASLSAIRAQTPEADTPVADRAASDSPDAKAATPTRVIEGAYHVTVDFVSPDRGTKSDRIEQVKRIEFNPEYIVIFEQNDAGRVIPVHSIGQLRWDPS